MYFVVHNQSPVEMGRCVYDTVVWNDVWEMVLGHRLVKCLICFVPSFQASTSSMKPSPILLLMILHSSV
jgi:hypothetical protein